MRKRIFAVVLAAALTFAVCGCGEENKPIDGSAQGGSVTQSGVGQDGFGDEKTEDGTIQDDKGEGSGSGASNDASAGGGDQQGTDGAADSGRDFSDRHFYKSVAFYGYLHQMYLSAPIDANYGMDQYLSALVLDYDTATGDVNRIRMCVYFEGTDNSMDQDRVSQRRENAIRSAGSELSEMPYTEEVFYYGDRSIKDKMHVLIWDYEVEGQNVYNFEQFIQICFLEGEYYETMPDWFVPQDIDGFIQRVFYEYIESSYKNGGYKPEAHFGDNFFFCRDESYVSYTVCWYDTDWDITMYDPFFDVSGYGFDWNAPWEPSEYGSTSYNTGGGYTGTYRYEDCVKH